jgi:terminase large subunit-like protein
MYALQEQAFFCPERYSIVEASTKAGKTVGCMCWLAEQAMTGKSGRNYWWIAPIYAQAKVAFRRLKNGLPPQVYTANGADLTITLANGAVIWFKSAENPDALYGEDVYAAVIDEASRCKEESWHAVRSTLTATRGPIRIIGNVKGRKNWAYHLARKAQSGEPGMRYTKITAYDAVAAGVLDQQEIDDAERLLPAAVFQELYKAEPSDDAGNPFGIAAISACVGELSTAASVVWGWDLAKSIDWTVGIALDASGAVCRFERWNKTQLPPGIAAGTDYWEATIARIRSLTGILPALVDSTGVGDPILEAIAKQRPPIEGYHFTAPGKQKLMEGLAVAIQKRSVSFPDGEIRAELDDFEYVYTRTGVTYSAPSGAHDDCVCALALAVQCLNTPKSALPFAWLRNDPAFQEQVRKDTETDAERVARRLAARG